MSCSKMRRRAFVSALALGALTGVAALPVPASADARPISAEAPVRGPAGLGLDPLGDIAAAALSQLDTGDPLYVATRDALAGAIADRVGLDAGAMRMAWAHADHEHQRALLAGLTQLGVRYRRNTSRPGEGFDCSGLTTYAWGVAGFTLTRQSGGQIKAASPRVPETAQAGDLVWYPGHVSMWLGVDRGILHSPYPGKVVEVKIQGGNKSLKFGDPTG